MSEQHDERGPDWLVKAFAEHYPADASRVINNMVQASIAQQIEGGVLTERSYPVDAITDAVVRAKDGGLIRIVVPETEMTVIPSADVPTGRVHHVLHFTDGDHRLFSRVWQEDWNPVPSDT